MIHCRVLPLEEKLDLRTVHRLEICRFIACDKRLSCIKIPECPHLYPAWIEQVIPLLFPDRHCISFRRLFFNLENANTRTDAHTCILTKK